MQARAPAARTYADLLVGTEVTDDAVVWRLNDGQPLIAPTHFLMPMGHNPFDLGRRAVACDAQTTGALLVALDYPMRIRCSTSSELKATSRLVRLQEGSASE